MPLSRLRIQLAAWFALAFLVGLGILDLSLLWSVRRAADRRLSRDLSRTASELLVAARREFADFGDSSAAAAARGAIAEWPTGLEAVAVYDSLGERLAVAGPAPLAAQAPARSAGQSAGDIRLDAEGSARPVWLNGTEPPKFTVLAVGSTDRLQEDDEALALWLAVSTPLVVILALVGGYMMSRRALRPIGRMERAVAAMVPRDLARRLPVAEPEDEVGRLAAQFNALLDRLEQSQAQSRAFLRRAAHQIRTPLTLVLGESELGIARSGSAGAHEALERIHRAAGRMQRRVNELFLLAQAEAGETITLDATVDLEGTAIEAADMMRGRAHGLGRHLELGRVEPVEVRGSEPLLQEAVLELLENACRHSAAAARVSVAVFRLENRALLSVSSEGAAPAEPAAVADEARGFGLAIVRWIAEQHGGRLVHTRSGSMNTYVLELPALAA
ncbi:MAG: HAMP domain-containing sensor histidine kinase [Gemmatimonadota bacterium]